MKASCEIVFEKHHSDERRGNWANVVLRRWKSKRDSHSMYTLEYSIGKAGEALTDTSIIFHDTEKALRNALTMYDVMLQTWQSWLEYATEGE